MMEIPIRVCGRWRPDSDGTRATCSRCGVAVRVGVSHRSGTAVLLCEECVVGDPALLAQLREAIREGAAVDLAPGRTFLR